MVGSEAYCRHVCRGSQMGCLTSIGVHAIPSLSGTGRRVLFLCPACWAPQQHANSHQLRHTPTHVWHDPAQSAGTEHQEDCAVYDKHHHHPRGLRCLARDRPVRTTKYFPNARLAQSKSPRRTDSEREDPPHAHANAHATKYFCALRHKVSRTPALLMTHRLIP